MTTQPLSTTSNALSAFVGLTNTRLEVYRWAAEHLSDGGLREIFEALLQQAKTFKQRLADLYRRKIVSPPREPVFANLPPSSADVDTLFDLLDQLDEAETHAVAQLRVEGLVQQTIQTQRAATRTLNEALGYLRQYA